MEIVRVGDRPQRDETFKASYWSVVTCTAFLMVDTRNYPKPECVTGFSAIEWLTNKNNTMINNGKSNQETL